MSDPSAVQGIQEVEAAILFIDAVHSSRVARELSIGAYDRDFIEPLQECYKSVLTSYRILEHRDEVKDFEGVDIVEGRPIEEIMCRYACDQNQKGRPGNVTCEFDIRGDQFTAIFFSGKGLETDIEVAGFLALGVFDRWLQREPNLGRMEQGLSPYLLRAGLHCGRITVGKRRYGIRERAVSAEGYAINVAKKISNLGSGGGESKIFVSGLCYNQLIHGVRKEAKPIIQCRSMNTDFQGYEVFELVYVAAPTLKTFRSPQGKNIPEILLKYFLEEEIKYPINLAVIKDLEDYLVKQVKQPKRFDRLKERVCRYLKISEEKLTFGLDHLQR